MICNKCGNVNPENIRFCSNCGNQLEQNTTSNKPNNKLKIIIPTILLVILVGIVGIITYKKFSNNISSNNGNIIANSTSFFIKNKDNKYAMFNVDGKKLTDFDFSLYPTINNGIAVVKNDNDQYGVIAENGKMIIEFGKYKYINQEGGLLEVTDQNSKKYLLNNNGKEIMSLENKDVKSFLLVDTFVIVESEKEYSVINYKGNKILSFNLVEDLDSPDTSYDEDNHIASIFYNNKNYIIDIVNGKLLKTFDADKHYCLYEKDENENILLHSCVGTFERQDKVYYKLLTNNKIINLSEKCDSISYGYTTKYKNLICDKDNKDYILDNNYKEGFEITSDIAYIDYKTYIQEKESFSGVDFYKDNKLVKNVSCRKISERGYIEQEIFLLGTYYSQDCGTDSGSYEFYDINGEKIIDKTFKDAELFDKNGLAIVSEDDTNYYLIDKKGNKVSDDYSNIIYYFDYYIVTKNDKEGIIGIDGKEIIPCNYEEVRATGTANITNNTFTILKENDSKYTVYNITEKKELFTSNKFPNVYMNYIEVSNNNKNEYYSYTTGKKFYEE